MLQNAYLLAKIGADTDENERNFAENFLKIGNYSTGGQGAIRVLNAVRKAKGLSQFSFRPHCGEAGDVSHLDTAFLLAEHINHGINLRWTPVLQYLYYICRIGLAVSALLVNLVKYCCQCFGKIGRFLLYRMLHT